MKQISGNSRATILFALEWQSTGVKHRDEMWTDQVNMWRDCFTPEFTKALTGTQEGEKVQTEIGVDSFYGPYTEKKIVQLPAARFYKSDLPVNPISARLGRYYPQNCLHGASSVLQTSVAPARCISKEENFLRFDLNHPLAGHELTLSAEILKVHSPAVERGGRCEDWLERLSNSGPGMQARYGDIATAFFIAEKMRPDNNSPDHIFYGVPRMVQHLDSIARQTIIRQYAKLIAPGARVLDLMGSWDSHLPSDIDLKTLTVLGMNLEELDANDRATETLFQDLNQNHNLPFEDDSFESIVCTASIEYLTDPLAVFAEIQRLLVPSGVFALAFSNRWFPPKAIKIWTELHEFERLGMVLEMFHRTSGFANINTLTRQGELRPEDDPHPEYSLSDPVYMAWGFKK
jgi:FKBP-type peptidyl-prolyl cis-trans isomerase 2